MNQLINSNNLTMSSRDLCEKINTFRFGAHQSEIRYFDFLIRIEDEIDDLPPNETFVNPSNGKTTKFYMLTKDQMLLVGMRESKVIRKKVLSWVNAIERTQPALPTTFAEALQLAANQAKEIEDQHRLIELQAPAVKFVDSYTQSSTGSKGFREVAKLLKIKENTFRAFLVDNKIMYMLGGDKYWVAYQKHVDAGRFEVTTGESGGHIYNTTKFTGKGITWIAGLYAQSQIEEIK